MENEIPTSKKIIAFIKENQQTTVNQLIDFLGITAKAVHKQLAKLLDENKLEKTGTPPKVFYFLKKETAQTGSHIIDNKINKIIEDNFLLITPYGEKKEGVNGFVYWCEKTKQKVEKTAIEYIETLKKYQQFRKNGLIDGTEKIKNSFEKSFLDKMFYLDFYNIERFGKTKLGQLLLYAKQNQDKKLIKEITEKSKPEVEKILIKYKIDGVAFVSPSVKRQVQLIKELQKNLNLKTQLISIFKAKTEIVVPQKTLSKIEDRIENARRTFFVDESRVFENILLIDDAVGSGATFNELAAKINAKKICKGKVIGLAITGSFKGFDVISEV